MLFGAQEARINPHKLKEKLLFVKDIFGYNVRSPATEKDNLHSLEALWSWAKEVEISTN